MARKDTARNYVDLAKKLDSIKKGTEAFSKTAANLPAPFKTVSNPYGGEPGAPSFQSGVKATSRQKKLLDNLINHYGYEKKTPSARQNAEPSPAARNLPQSAASSQTPESFTEDDYREYKDKLDLAKFAARYGQFSFYRDLGYSDEEIDQLKLNYEAFCLGEQEIAALLSAGYITDKEAIEELEELYADESYTQLTEQNLKNLARQADASASNVSSQANAPLNSYDLVNRFSPVNVSAPANASSPQKSSASDPSSPANASLPASPPPQNLEKTATDRGAAMTIEYMKNSQNSNNVEGKVPAADGTMVDPEVLGWYNWMLSEGEYGEQNDSDDEPIDPAVITTSSTGIDFIKAWEGLSLTVYDATGNGDWTIGCGHKIFDKNNSGSNLDEVEYYRQHPLTPDEAEALFQKDLEMIMNTALRPLLVGNNIRLNQHQFDALVSFSFNLGQNYWKKQTDGYRYLAQMLLDGDFSEETVKKNFLSYKNKTRRKQEANIFIYGIYDSSH